MARASYVYVVVNGCNEPCYTFTVKHECASLLTRLVGYRVVRFRDGCKDYQNVTMMTDDEVYKGTGITPND